MAQEIADSTLLDTWASSGLKVEPDISKIIEGWQFGEQPPHEYMNWLQNTFGSKLNHILKNGVAGWNVETEYLSGATVQHNGNVWLCKTTNTDSEPTELNNNWDKIPSIENLALTVDTIEDLATYTGSGLVLVKDINRGGTFVSKLSTDIDPLTRVAYVADGGRVFTKYGGGFWARQYDGEIKQEWYNIFEVDLHITYGQSNSVGYANGNDYRVSNINKKSLYWNGTNIVSGIYEMVQSSGEISTGNAWIPFAEEYISRTNRTILTVPCAKGATSIAELSKGNAAGWYSLMLASVNNAKASVLASGKTIGKIWVSFHQGETDQTLGTSYNDYIALLNTLISDFKTDVSFTKFLIYYVGFPRNRPEQNWMQVINAQRYVATYNKDAICGFADCQSFTRESWSTNSDLVHYNQPALNIMGTSGAKVAVDLLINMKAHEFITDRELFGLSFPRDRIWNFYSATLINETESGGWVISNRTSNPSILNDALSNINSITPITSRSISYLSLGLSAPSEDFMELSCRYDSESANGFTFIAKRIDALNIGVFALFSGSFLISTTGVLTHPEGSPVTNQAFLDLITIDSSVANQYTITINGELGNMPLVTPYADANTNTANVSLPKVRTNGVSSIVVRFPVGGHSACIIGFNNVRVDIKDIRYLGRIQVFGIGGVSSN